MFYTVGEHKRPHPRVPMDGHAEVHLPRSCTSPWSWLLGEDFLSNHGAATGLAGLWPCPETLPASVVLQLGPSSLQEQVRSSWVYDSFSF